MRSAHNRSSGSEEWQCPIRINFSQRSQDGDRHAPNVNGQPVRLPALNFTLGLVLGVLLPVREPARPKRTSLNWFAKRLGPGCHRSVAPQYNHGMIWAEIQLRYMKACVVINRAESACVCWCAMRKWRACKRGRFFFGAQRERDGIVGKTTRCPYQVP